MKTIQYDILHQTITQWDKDLSDIKGLNRENLLFYDSDHFQMYHQRFAEEVNQLIVTKEGNILGHCTIGTNKDALLMPYSAPFSMVYMKDRYRMADLKGMVTGIEEYARQMNHKTVSITLPPAIYGQNKINDLSSVLWSHGWRVSKLDINHHFDLTEYTDKQQHLEKLPHMTRKNYRKGLKFQLKFRELPLESFACGYQVIQKNRSERGYPLKISQKHMEALLNMEQLRARCFLVEWETIPIASAFVFDITKDVSQVIYWGDIPSYREMSPITFLAIELFDFYAKLNKRILDIGPSSDVGIINEGLADFKKTLGCSTSVKLSFQFSCNAGGGMK